MREWCARRDFRASLEELLRGEDPAFVSYITMLAEQEGATAHEP